MSAAHFPWLPTGSTLSPMILQLRLENSGSRPAMYPSSVVQTGVKSFGCENRTAQPSPIHSWKSMVPCVVSAVKFGAVSLMRKDNVSLHGTLSVWGGFLAYHDLHAGVAPNPNATPPAGSLNCSRPDEDERGSRTRPLPEVLFDRRPVLQTRHLGQHTRSFVSYGSVPLPELSQTISSVRSRRKRVVIVPEIVENHNNRHNPRRSAHKSRYAQNSLM